MDIPVSDSGPVKEDAPVFHCDQCDTEMVHKMAQLLLPGLATACIDNTTGDLFKGPGSVAADLRKEMVEYLTQRSESFVAESLVPDNENNDLVEKPLDDPMEIISQFMDDFSGLNRSLLSRVSGWLLSESREDKIDDFVQEMEMDAFWTIERREVVAQVLLKNVDFKNTYHCSMSFESEQQVEEHRSKCTFRMASCNNDGCKAKFSATHAEKHDSECPYKVIPCEQMCSATLTRREMDRHCVTKCPMRLVNCPFYQVGCQSAFSQCNLQQHCVEFLSSHVLYILQLINNQQASPDDLKERLQEMEKLDSFNALSEALDVRSLTAAVKRQEAKLKELEHQEYD